MPARLTFWFELASSYSYLSAMRIDPMAEARGVAVEWRPFPLGPIFGAQGWDNSPFNIYPVKGRYMWRDMERLCDARGLPFLPIDDARNFPQNSIRALRVSLAALETEKGRDFVRALYLAQFGDGQDITEAGTIRAALAKSGLPEELAEAADDPAYKDALKANSAASIAAGLFGAPSFTVGQEVFWGDDRLEDALDWAAKAQE